VTQRRITASRAAVAAASPSIRGRLGNRSLGESHAAPRREERRGDRVNDVLGAKDVISAASGPPTSPIPRGASGCSAANGQPSRWNA
jgi:hypothetical protein